MFAVFLSAAYFVYGFRISYAPSTNAPLTQEGMNTDAAAVPPVADPALSFVQLPAGFRINTFLEFGGSFISNPGPNSGARMMAYKDGVLYISLTKQGKVIAAKGADGVGHVTSVTTFIANQKNPHGLVWNGEWLYIALEDKLIRVKDADHNLQADMDTLQTIAPLPSGGHFTRTVSIHDGRAYVSVGSSCNVCNEKDAERAAVLECDLEPTSSGGKGCAIFAKGLRNSVGIAWRGDALYGTDNGRDLLGNNLPPEEVNIIERGRDYGWPNCYGNKVPDKKFNAVASCDKTIAPVATIPAHIAPLGLRFFERGAGSVWPKEYANNLFVASHGSWNRTPADGYRIYRIIFENGPPSTLAEAAAHPSKTEIFVDGFLSNAGLVRGRPVDILFVGDSMFVSDDNQNKIYRIFFGGK